MFAKTATRVEEHTRPSINARIHRKAVRRLDDYRRRSPEGLRRRLDELDAEWDVERAVEAHGGLAVLATLLMSRLVDRRFLIGTAAIGAFLLRHALVGRAPQTAVFRALGFRTPSEIDEERRAVLDLLATHPGR